MVKTPSDGVCLVILAQGWHGLLLLDFSFDCTRWAKCLGGNASRDADLSPTHLLEGPMMGCNT
jgi:hypothetical protein